MKDTTKTKADLIGEILATQSLLQRAGDREQALRVSIELAYGLLWLAPYDASSPQGQCISLARRTLLGELDRDGQARGITAAREQIRRDAESRKNSRTGNDDYTNPFGYQRKSSDD